jgi:hypothetical protein
MIEWGHLRYPTASDNLRHWRDGGGRERLLPTATFASESFFLDHLRDRHRPRFIAGAERRFKGGAVGVGSEFDMTWEDSVYAPPLSDLYFALGGFTVQSAVTAVVQTVNNLPVLQFRSWKSRVLDEYDWDPGKSTLIPGIGRITDDEMLALERAGYGMAYRIRSEWVPIADSSITGDAPLPP